MSPTVNIRNCILGEGRPKICIPIVGRTKEEILLQAEHVKKSVPDIVEWRMDFLNEIQDRQVCREAVKSIREVLEELPFLCTFRTKAEGGEQEISPQVYRDIYETVMDTGYADAIDVEFFLEKEITEQLIQKAHKCNLAVVGSNHDFDRTPEKEELVLRLCGMQKMGMDVAKIAVMPQTEKDVLILLEATLEMKQLHPETPVITMSMGKLGVISRIAGELFGSALTFGTAGSSSAPGQIPAEELKTILEVLHR